MPGPGARRLQENPSFASFQILFCSLYKWREAQCPTGSSQKPNPIRKNTMCILTKHPLRMSWLHEQQWLQGGGRGVGLALLLQFSPSV